jgi:RNA polymerase sigma factor (sigma-70 family)
MTELELKNKNIANTKCSELIICHRGGDLSAFGKLVSFNSKALYRYLFSLYHNKEDAEDASQEVWMICLKSFGNGAYVERQMFKGWLLRAAKFYFLNMRRGVKFELIFMDVLPDEIVELFEDLDLKETRLVVLMEIVDALPENDFKILYLKYFEKKTGKEIDEALGMAERIASGGFRRFLRG